MQEKSPIKQNILKFIEYKGISKYEFYKKTGITRGVLDQNNGMSEDNTTRFRAYFNEVNPSWLLLNDGEMLLKDVKEEKKESITSCQNCDILRNYIKVLEAKLAEYESNE